MPKANKKISKRVGLPPGTLVHIGEKKIEKTKITVMDYDEENFLEKELERPEESFPFKDKPTVTWINIAGIHQVEIIEKIGKNFGLHPLLLEDILDTQQRPKIDYFEDYIFVVLKMPSYNEKQNEIREEQVSIAFGSNFVISFQESEWDVFNPIRKMIREGKGRIRKMGPDYLAYSLIDALVDNYFTILEKMGERVENVEERVVTNPTPETLQTIHKLKRDMIFLRRSVWPLREVVDNLERAGSPLVQESTNIYLRDVYDHTIEIIDTIESLREIITGMLDIYLSSISNKMNEIMKVLTIIATIFIPLTFVTGIYGMNFRFMPELKWEWGYYITLAVMLAIVMLMLAYFRRKKWL